MYLLLMYCIKAVICRLYDMLYPCICNVVISRWKSGAYGFVICRGGTDMCFVPGSGWKHLYLEQYRISGLTVAYKLELPPHLSQVHDDFHVSQLRRCFKDPIREVDHETLDLQDNLSYREYPVRILDEAERSTRRQKIIFFKVQWSHHSEKEATWEREDRLQAEYPTFLPTTSESRDEILLSGGAL